MVMTNFTIVCGNQTFQVKLPIGNNTIEMYGYLDHNGKKYHVDHILWHPKGKVEKWSATVYVHE